MKELLLLSIAIVAMVVSSAGQTQQVRYASMSSVKACSDNADCGGSVPDCTAEGEFDVGYCTNFNTDRNNCGGIGTVCTASDHCSNGSCTCFGDPDCDVVIAPNQNSKVLPRGKNIPLWAPRWNKLN